MAPKADLQHFQEVLNRVAQTGKREEIDGEGLPEVRAWSGIESRGCIICVERGRWWVLPPS